MKTEPLKIKITSIGQMVTSHQAHTGDYRVLSFSFIELPADSPTGRYKEDGPPILGECHNENIGEFVPSAGEIYWATFVLFHGKRVNNTATNETRYLLTSLKPV